MGAVILTGTCYAQTVFFFFFCHNGMLRLKTQQHSRHECLLKYITHVGAFMNCDQVPQVKGQVTDLAYSPPIQT